MAILLLIVILVITLALVFYLRWKKSQDNYWPNLGFKVIDPKVLTGIFKVIFSGMLQHEADAKMYEYIKNTVKKPYLGFMEFSKPCLFVVDLNLIKNVFVKDFDYFSNRREINALEETDPMFFKMLFFMEDDPWKELRAKMSPTFTTGKIKRMFQIFNSSGYKLVEHLEKSSQKNNVADFCDAYERYTMDVIASAAFGLDAKTFTEESPIFSKMGKRMQQEVTPQLMATFVLMLAAPKVAVALGLGFIDKKCAAFFTEVILSVIRHREATGEKRDDFLQLMLEARNGQLKSVDEGELDTFEKEAITSTTTNSSAVGKQDKVMLTDDVIVAQSVLFILAGFDTTQTLLLFCVYELALNPEVQDKLSEEIESFLNNNDGKFNYDAINHMEYLDKVVNETLRKYPPVPRLERRTKFDYKIPDTDLTIPKDALIAIPTFSIHYDEEHFPNAQKFDPERFSPEIKNTRHPYAFQPFGHGPRNCIGMRFALMNAKMAIANIVHNFILEPSEKTQIPMKFARNTSLKPQNMLLKVTRRF